MPEKMGIATPLDSSVPTEQVIPSAEVVVESPDPHAMQTVSGGTRSPGNVPGAGPDYPMNRLREEIAKHELMIKELSDNVHDCSEEVQMLNGTNKLLIQVMNHLSERLDNTANSLDQYEKTTLALLKHLVEGTTPAVEKLSKRIASWQGVLGVMDDVQKP